MAPFVPPTTPPVLPVRRVVIGQNAHAAMNAGIRAARPDLEVRGAVFTDITDADLAWADAYIGFKRPPQVSSMGAVRWVHSTGAGVDAWLLPDPPPTSIVLTRTPESFGPMIAEWALARALADVTGLRALAEAQRERHWAPCEIQTLRGTRVLVVGTGDVGTAVGRLFRDVGCVVHGVSRSGAADASVFAQVYSTAQLADAVSHAAWIIVTLPLTVETRGLFSSAVLSRCNGAFLMNAGRGAVLDEGAIPHALDAGWLRGAALDVFEVEPLPQSSPIWDDARVVISPHVSGLTTVDGAIAGFLECLATFERDEFPQWIVDRARGY
jgi:D-2-hydroxyacid dehydrogenase (NADP+)